MTDDELEWLNTKVMSNSLWIKDTTALEVSEFIRCLRGKKYEFDGVEFYSNQSLLVFFFELDKEHYRKIVARTVGDAVSAASVASRNKRLVMARGWEWR